MNNILTQFASEKAADGSLFQALGIDWRMLVFQIIGFVILVLLLAKFVFPVFNKVIDAREKSFKASAEAAEQAKKDAEAAEKRIAKELAEAKKQAADTIDIAHKESAAMLAAAEEKAKKRADHIVESAHASLEQDVRAARETLKDEMKSLVADATETVIKQKLDTAGDKKLITEALAKEGR